MSEGKSMLKSKSFAFAVRCINLYKYLVESKKEFVLSKQILRSDTSIGANIRGAQNAQSKADFIHKLSISQKECDETIYWLELLVEIDFISKEEFHSINNEALELLKMLRRAIITAKKNNSKTHNS